MSDFDFGFTAVNADELEGVLEAKAAVTDAQHSEVAVTDRLVEMFNAIEPLLNNLMANPEKDYIHWPNRVERIEDFLDVLTAIRDGE